MGFRRLLIAVVLVFALLPTSTSQGRRGEAYIDGVRLSRGKGGDLVLAFRVEKALDSRIEDTLDSGLPVRFTYWALIVHPRDFLPDENLVERKLIRVLEKDNLKNRFQVTWKDTGESRSYATLEEAVDVMTKVAGLHMTPIKNLEGHRPLFLKIKAQLQKFQLPFRLHYLFAFVSYWDVETDWYTLELPAAQALQ